jgi:hypothetical protein
VKVIVAIQRPERSCQTGCTCENLLAEADEIAVPSNQACGHLSWGDAGGEMEGDMAQERSMGIVMVRQ